MEEINLFDLIPDESRVTLNEEQKRLIAVVKNRPTTAELHFANLINDPENLLKEGKALGLPLPDQKLFVAVGERTAVNKLGYLSWIGKGKSPLDTATLILSPEGEVGGTLRVEGSIYQFEPLGEGLMAIILIDKSKFLPDHPPEFDPAAFIDTTTVDIGNEFNPEEKNILLSSAPNPGPEIDLLVVYTPTVASASSDINLLIDDAVSQTITTFGNSAVGANVVLQHSAQVNYNESGQTIIQHLTSLIDPSDGIMDNVHSLRNQYMADIVVLLVDDNQYCGVATLLAQQTTAFAVVNYQCATTNITFAHEIGHLMGAQHDPFVNDDNPHFDYGYGYVDPNNQWRTIMAYGNACNNCARIPYWSNPNVNHPITNQPMGTSSEHNNARVLNITQYDVRDFRTLSPPQSFIITNRYSYNQSPHFTWIEHPQADYHRVYRCLTTSGTYPPSCFMLVGGGTDEWTDYNLTIYDPYSPPGGGNCPQSAIYQMTTENRTGESNFTHQINVCIN